MIVSWFFQRRNGRLRVRMNQAGLNESTKFCGGYKIIGESAKGAVPWPLMWTDRNWGDMSPEFPDNRLRRVWWLAGGFGWIYYRNTFDLYSFQHLHARFWCSFCEIEQLRWHCLLSFELVDRPESSFIQNPFTVVENDSMPCKKCGNETRERGSAYSTGPMETSETCLLSFCKKMGIEYPAVHQRLGDRSSTSTASRIATIPSGLVVLLSIGRVSRAR